MNLIEIKELQIEIEEMVFDVKTVNKRKLKALVNGLKMMAAVYVDSSGSSVDSEESVKVSNLGN